MLKAGDDPKKQRRVKKKQPPEGFVSWNKQTFEHLIEKPPEKLTPRMRITHSMVLSEVEQGGDARAHVDELIADSAADRRGEGQAARARRRDIRTRSSKRAWWCVARTTSGAACPTSSPWTCPRTSRSTSPLSPFLLAALELLDPESPDYALDVISLVEATLEDPAAGAARPGAQGRATHAMAEMKADGVDYEERLERLAEITYPKPLEELLDARASNCTARAVPWARDYELSPEDRCCATWWRRASGLQDLHPAATASRRSEGTLAALPVRRVPRARAARCRPTR